MKRKFLLIFFTLLALLFINTISFATNNLKTDIQNATNTVVDGSQRLGNDVKNGIEKASGAIEDGARNLGNTVSNGMQNVGNGITNGMDNMTNNTNSDYTATRTATNISNADITNSTLWTWGTIAVAGAVIVGLVWYYAAEHNTER